MRLLMIMVGLLGALTVAGCGGVAGTPAPASAPASTSAGAPAADVGACFDGDCEISVSDKVSIPLDDKFGITSLSAEVISKDQVRLSYRGVGGTGNVTLRQTGTVSLGGITIQASSLAAGAAKLRISGRR